MNGRCCQAQQPHGVEKSNKVNYTNRNSTGSTNSSQTSSGFESSKVGIFWNLILRRRAVLLFKKRFLSAIFY